VQLGTRWTVGEEPPAKIPPAIVAAIKAVELERAARGDVDTSQWRWTLTWLEGLPVAELDDGTIIRVGTNGEPSIAREPEL
jgi:hypothetical protein